MEQKNQRNIVIIYAIGMLQGMVFYAPIATLYRESQGISIFQITLIESISLILCLLLELPWGIIADKIGYKWTMIVCCMLYFASKIVFWQAESFGAFLLERVMLSVVIAGMSGVDTSILYLSSREGQSQKIFGIYNAIQTVGLLSAAFLFSLFIGENYKLAGFLTVISYAVAAVLSLGLTDVKKKETEEFQWKEFIVELGHVLRSKYLMMLLVGTALFSETHQTITVFLSQLQYKRCHLPVAAIGLIYIVITIAGLCGAMSSWFTKRLGTRRLTDLIYGTAILSCLLLAFSRGAIVSIGSILALRIAFELFQPLQLELQNREIVTANRATALSINAVILDSIGAATNVAFGKVADQHLSWAFLLGAVLCMAGFVLQRKKQN